MSGTRRIKRRIRKRVPLVFGGDKQLGGSVSFPATFGGSMDRVHPYPLNTFGGDPTHTSTMSRLLGGKSKRKTRRTKKTRRSHKKMHGGNFIGGLTPLNQTLGGNAVMNAGSLMGTTTTKL